MKIIFRLFIVLGFITAIPNLSSFSQVSINTDGSAAHNSAMLEVKSVTKGFLPPSMTTTQMNAISSPAEGLMVYNTSLQNLFFYNGTAWQTVTLTDVQHTIGENYGGGIIFFIDNTGQHGLICAASDQISYANWGMAGNSVPGTSTAIGSGQANTTAIVNLYGDLCWAAWLCDQLELNGYNDWFLPSLDELNEMWVQKDVIGGLDYNTYWSSSEYDAHYAWDQYFGGNTYQSPYQKNYGLPVRAVRAF